MQDFRILIQKKRYFATVVAMTAGITPVAIYPPWQESSIRRRKNLKYNLLG